MVGTFSDADIATPSSSDNGVKTDYYSHNPLFECLVCSRQVSSNRYATHLEKCMGLSAKGTRKTTRSAKAASSAVTQRILSTSSRSASPAAPRAVSANVPRKRGASPTPLAASAREKQIKTEYGTPTPQDASTPQSGAKAALLSSAARASQAGDSTLSTSAATQTHTTDAAAGTEDADSEDLEFAATLSISVCMMYLRQSDSEDEASVAGYMEPDELPAQPADDGLEDVEFDLDEEDASETNELDFNVDVSDSDNDDSDM